MKRAILLLLVAACDDGEGANPYACMAAGGGGCFEMPTDAVLAVNPDGTLDAPFLACAPFDVAQSAGPQTFAGATIYTRTQERAKAVAVDLYSDVALTSPLGTTISDEAGAFTLDTAGGPNLVFARASKDGYLAHVHLYQRVDLADAQLELQTATRAELAERLESVGDQFLPGSNTLATLALDCADRPLANAIANLAPVSGKNGSHLFVPNVRVYYDTEGGTLARRTQQMQTTAEGTLAMSNIPAGQYFLQLWGFVSTDDVIFGVPALKLLDEVEVTIAAGEANYVVPLHARQ